VERAPENLFEILMDFLGDIILLTGLKKNTTEEKINENLQRLRQEDWFKLIFSEHMELFLKDKEIRLFIGKTNVGKIVTNEKKQKKLIEVLLRMIHKKGEDN
jgi:hypothetical protein